MSASVLVIDDDPSFANSVKYLLNRQGIRTTVANGPTQALKIYAEAKMDFDLLMIDYNFEHTNVTGADLTEKIRLPLPIHMKMKLKESQRSVPLE